MSHWVEMCSFTGARQRFTRTNRHDPTETHIYIHTHLLSGDDRLHMERENLFHLVSVVSQFKYHM